jgi:aminoglycoside 3-N-acetyltransferase
MPTFTYSFCEGRDFDLAGSASTVGALTEHFRRRPGVRRTTDPIFSAAVAGEVAPEWEERLFGVHDVNCFGSSSVFAWLRELDAVLLFFGVGIEACTYLHHVEQRHEVPYRFFKDFHGVVRTAERHQDVTATYFVRPLDGSVEFNPERLEAALLESGRASQVTLADGPRLMVTTAREVERTAVERMTENPAFLLHSDLPSAGT